ncbi:hypothetical protein F5B22DRAFT_596742 [Xylaria bambusicola]|uniref:uncharacterized protein n=1 Tax=Xylaria bambusicola TaxID=326684 RepID=UPI0020086D62|nr:uncharacterized protein F5B22DRAFT_596742 [Xylaria bambusicola]KAI0521405.1 hypothetical protein F5B22DRAFT_596742 [Xylaria bambusicola]
MPSILCCSSIKPYRPTLVDHEPKFTQFMRWAKSDPVVSADESSLLSSAAYAIQLVRQVNYGPQESIRYFVPASGSSDFLEVTENELIPENFEKLNSFKNFKCDQHNKFFDVNLYQKNPVNTHHWRANLAQPSRDIDLASRSPEQEQNREEGGPSQDCPPSDPDPELSPPEPSGSLAPGHHSSEVELHEKDTLAQLLVSCSTKISTLKPILQFLLPRLRSNLGSNSILSLLSLDWVNRELGLGIDYEDLWESELTAPNIAIFLNDCIELSVVDSVNPTNIIDLVAHTLNHMSSLKDKEAPGRVKLERIISRVFESDASASWVTRNRDNIKHIITYGPSEEMLQSSRYRDEEVHQDRLRHKHARNVPGQFIEEEYLTDDERDRYGRESEYESYSPMKDYTACDKECGYCGNCDY